MRLSATDTPYTKPAHTAWTSNAAPLVMPRAACTRVAVAGNVWSGVAVARTIRSRSDALMPRMVERAL